MTWSLGDLTFDNKKVQPSEWVATRDAFQVADSGTKLYCLNATEIDQYDLTTPYDIETATHVGTFVHGLNSVSSPSQMAISCDGKTLWANDFGASNESLIKEFTLSTAWDITTASLTNTKDNTGVLGTFSGYAWSWSKDGQKWYAYGAFPNVYEFDVGTAYDISTISYTGNSFALNTVTGIAYVTAFRVSNDGTTFLMGQFNSPNRQMYEIAFGTPYDITTLNTTATNIHNLTGDSADIIDSDNFCVDECATKLYHDGSLSAAVNYPYIWQWDMGAQVTSEPCCGGPAADCPDVTYNQGGVVRLTTGTLSGFWWLGCDTVKALVDGNVVDLAVCEGNITLPRTAARAHIGLSYTADIETLNIAVPQGSVEGGRKKVTDVTTRFYKSRLPLIGPNFEDMVQMKQREDEAYGEPTGLLDGDHTKNIPPEWNTHGRVAYRQKDPVPTTWLAVVPEFEVEDDG